MTKLIHTYSLQAFPTEKYLKEFQPVRGMRFSGRIDLDPKDQEVLRESSLSRHLDRRSWLGTRVVPDVVPVFRLIAEKIAHVLTGGMRPVPGTVTAQDLLDLEREAFVSLAGTQKTRDRIAHMLNTGKPLRN